jgi:hypothetical protein
MSESERHTNIVAIDGAARPDKMADLLRSFRNDLPNLIQIQALQAQVTRAKFVALVESGFTVAEALELCK